MLNLKTKTCLYLLVLLILSPFFSVKALTPGALVYRTSTNGMMYGYSSDNLLETKSGILRNIYPGHVGIYIGEENGEHYIVEALAGGIVKTKAENFVNKDKGEKLLGAKLPIEAGPIERLKAVIIAKNLANANLGYDFNFKLQKGYGDGDWTCVGLVEKIYESSGVANPSNLKSLEYDKDYYKIDITPDGFDNVSIFNDYGDCFSEKYEFSKIERRKHVYLPSPEIIGFNAGLEYRGERYFFLPYTQYLQDSLKDEYIDINLSSYFRSSDVRGKKSNIALMFRWSMVNNPLSSIKNIAHNTSSKIKKIITNISGKKNDDIVIMDYEKRIDNKGTNEINDVKSKIEINKRDYTEKNDDTESVAEKSEKILIKKEKKENNANNESDKTFNKELQESKIIVRKKEKSEELNEKNEENLITQKIVNPSKEQDDLPEIIKKNFRDEDEVKIVEPTSDVGDVLPESNINVGEKPSDLPIPDSSEEVVIRQPSPTALISKVYGTGMNDFIELYNPTNYDFDLAESGFRVEKAKTADNPSIAIRIGENKDGIFPGGTVIKAKGYYLIVRDDASDYFLSKADAISTRSEFGWTGKDYTIYLGKGAISSSDDEDIIDALGFGNATYFRGSGPAQAIPDNYFLNRVNESNDNSLDFELQVSADPSIVWEEEGEDDSSSDSQPDGNDESDEDEGGNEDDDGTENGDEENQDDENNDQNNSSDDNDENEDDNSEDGQDVNYNLDYFQISSSDWLSDFNPYSFEESINSDGVIDLWHFSDCYMGDYLYSVGKFNCSIEIGARYPSFESELSQDINANNFSLSFYYRNSRLRSSANPRIVLDLRNEDNQYIEVLLQEAYMQIEGLPNSDWRYRDISVFPEDDGRDWKLFTLTVNKDDGYWIVYIDGQEKLRESFMQTLPSNLSEIKISGDMDSASIDELIIWNRVLSPQEVASNWQKNAEFLPNTQREEQNAASLEYFWDFNEGHELINEGGGVQAVDEINNIIINLPNNSWRWRGENNSAILNEWGKDLSVDLPEDLIRKDLSISFWWRSDLSPDEGRSLISLMKGDVAKLGLVSSFYRRGLFFNGHYGIFSQGKDIDLPYDDKWHHFALVYNSYTYTLTNYIDGQQKNQMHFYPMKNGEEPNKILIKNESNKIEIDDLAIWEGALTSGQVQKIYSKTKEN